MKNIIYFNLYFLLIIKTGVAQVYDTSKYLVSPPFIDTIFSQTDVLEGNRIKDSLKIVKNKNDTLICVITQYKEKVETKIFYYYPSMIKKAKTNYSGLTYISQSWYISGNKKSLSYNGFFDVSWFESGEIEKLMHYESYYDKGISQSWYENGQKKSIITLGQTDNRYEKMWCENGQIFRDVIFDGEKATSKQYYCNGNLHGTSFYIDHPMYPVGKWEVYYENGNKWMEKYYEDSDSIDGSGVRTGEWKYWNENGKLEKIEFYKDNKLIETINYD